LVFLVLIAFVAACGSTHAVNAPQAALSKREYGAMLRAARKYKRVEKAKTLRSAIPRLGAACRVLESPPTKLLELSYYTCRSQVALLGAIMRAGATTTACKKANRSRRLNCTKRRFEVLAHAAKASAVTAAATNRAATARRIRGRCRAAVGVPARDVRLYRQVARHSAEFVRATDALDKPGILSAGRHLKGAFDSLEGSDEDPIKQIRACRVG
jgi:hypothetical protein